MIISYTNQQFTRQLTLSTIVFIWATCRVFGQGQPESIADANAQSGIITGMVVDATSKQPVEFATIAVLNRRDSSLVTGGVTNEKGAFTVDQIPVGAYRVRISYIGYRNSVRDNLVIQSRKLEVNLGTIQLRPSAQNLEEVVVTAEKEQFQTSIDKRVFDVQRNIVSEGGSATDVLQTVPSVSVDVDGNINLRGSGNVIVLINGRPSSLTGADRSAILDQLPANSIERVEVVTNPSARYDAEGMAGIINIILKKNELRGGNGSASVSVGTRDKYNAAVNLNYRTPKFNIFGSYSYRYSDRFTNGYNSRLSLLNDSTPYLIQNQDGDDLDRTHVIRAGVDYFLGQRTTIGISSTYNIDEENEVDNIVYRELDAARNLAQLYSRANSGLEKQQSGEAVLNFRQTFAKPAQELTASVSYSGRDENRTDLFRQQDYNLDYTPSGELPEQQYNLRQVNNYVIVAQADYNQPLNIFHEGKLEAGYKSTLREVDNDFIYQDYNNESNLWITDPARSNRFVYQEQVHAVYGNYSAKWEKFGYQLGLRLEQTLTSSEQKTSDQRFENNYFGAFPSVFLSYDLAETQRVYLNYSRRINRPNIRELNPFVDYSDPLNLRTGNPRLNPEFTNAFELSHEKSWKIFTLTSSVYYRRTDNVIQRIISLNDRSSTDTLTVTFQNLNNRDAYGMEFIAKNNLTKWWDVTTNFNFYRNVLNGANLANNFNRSNTAWSLSLLSNMSIPKVMQVQISGNYRGRMVTAQGVMREFYGLNVGFKRNVLKDNGSISLNISDVFNTQQFQIETSGEGFTQESRRKRESQIATLTFSYKFGKLQNDRRDRSGRENGNDGERQNSGEDMF